MKNVLKLTLITLSSVSAVAHCSLADRLNAASGVLAHVKKNVNDDHIGHHHCAGGSCDGGDDNASGCIDDANCKSILHKSDCEGSCGW